LTAPWIDPPLGGYTYQFGVDEYSDWLTYQPNFDNANPYFYSPQDLSKGCAYIPKGASSCPLLITSDANTLNFLDTPHSTLCPPSKSCIALTTKLVGVCGAPSPACNSPGPSAALFQLFWETNYNGSAGGIFNATTASLYPPDSGSGTGEVTVTSINGIQLPPAVSPSQVATTASGLAYSRVSQTFSGTVTITNISGSAISGPLQILLTGMTAGVTLVNATGSLSGTPYMTVPMSGSLAPGQSVTVSVQFKNPLNATINFTPALYSGGA
jgi:hypothetical protein